MVINFVRLAMGCSNWRGDEAATFSWGMAKAALPIFGHTRLVGLEMMGNVVVVVPMVVVVVVVPAGAVVVVDDVVVDPNEVEVEVVPDAVAGAGSIGTVISPLRARKSTEVPNVILDWKGFTDSIYWFHLVDSERHDRRLDSFSSRCCSRGSTSK